MLRNKLSLILFLAGFACLLGGLFFIWEMNSPRTISFDIKELNSPSSSGSKDHLPVFLQIKDLKINLPVKETSLVNGNWQIVNNGIAYLSSSAVPGETGNSIFYGHNWPNLLGNLIKAKTGQIIKVIFNDGQIKNFIIIDTAVVSPDNISFLRTTADKRLTLYTCTGFFDNKRFLVIADLLKKK